VGVAKPDPAPFQVALERLEVDRRAAWHVGDSAATDVQGAQAAGVFAVWLNRAGTSPRPGGPHPGLEVASLSEVAAALQRPETDRPTDNPTIV
jgi:FMN hydrolase / 5-amino-6-(5-phospho-D-ribitylamino)uracil phosphatase